MHCKFKFEYFDFLGHGRADANTKGEWNRKAKNHLATLISAEHVLGNGGILRWLRRILVDDDLLIGVGVGVGDGIGISISIGAWPLRWRRSSENHSFVLPCLAFPTLPNLKAQPQGGRRNFSLFEQTKHTQLPNMLNQNRDFLHVKKK